MTRASSLNRRRVLALACGSSLALPLRVLAASDWPARPIRVVCNFPAGSSPDALVRAVSLPLQQALGQPVVIDNRAGASGIIGADLVAKAAPDGHTFLMTAGSTITTSPHMGQRMPFDTARDLVPVAALARLNLYLMTRPDFPGGDVREFLAYLRAHPGKTSYGSAGNGTGLHIAGEMLKSQAGVFAVHVPYRGASLALQDLLAGQVDFYFDPGIALAHAKAGRLKLLAVAALQRSTLVPEVPTLHESGLKGFDAGTTHGLYAPAGTPADVIDRMNREVNAALATAPVRGQVVAMGAEPTPLSVPQYAELMREDSRRYGAVIRERRITASS